jgi:hypothetical protein
MRVSDLIHLAAGLKDDAYTTRAELARTQVIDDSNTSHSYVDINLHEALDGTEIDNPMLAPTISYSCAAPRIGICRGSCRSRVKWCGRDLTRFTKANAWPRCWNAAAECCQTPIRRARFFSDSR